MVAEWMITAWGADYLRSGVGVVDVGGEPGFVAAAFLDRGIPASVVDPVWGLTGKVNAFAPVWQWSQSSQPRFQVFKECFDAGFCSRNRDYFHGISAIVSMYGDEATEPCISVAASSRKPALIVPCNECVRFFPPSNPTYDGYVQACLNQSTWHGGQFETGILSNSPFVRFALVQSPSPSWKERALSAESEDAELKVPIEVLRSLGVLHQAVWKMELANQSRRVSAPGHQVS